MISTQEALDQIFALVASVGVETVTLRDAAGRVLAQDITPNRDQPPFHASSMDGYAMRGDDAILGQTLKVIGESAAGSGFTGTVKPGETVRIFTGAPVPSGADKVVIQENVTRDGDQIKITLQPEENTFIRPKGSDFKTGDKTRISRCLTPADLSLMASMNIAEVSVSKRPQVAIIATGNELVMPGETPGPDQIIASNSFGLEAMVNAAGGHARMLPIARDTTASLTTAFELARGADLIVTIGGASVGDHDLVQPVAKSLGMETAFYKVAMRPGKPLMAGKFGNSVMVGLPGNPVSSLVCGEVFIKPVLDKMLGLGAHARPRHRAKLTKPLKANGPREHYMRARHDAEFGQIQVFEKQDSSLLHVLAAATALLVRPPNDPAREIGDSVEYIPL